ncbi:alpha carbonic anhydrase 4-like [Abrus precatorius]|uniref:Carbonic anhydrase n=1 Tax=Abrus precatorius TaxID=3816 RepID=A0A8B8LAD2_ABRPR|nr:alpha carbonic anhydrase 4-like [Abrus precatorius]
MTLPTNLFSLLLLVLILYFSSFLATASESKADEEYTYAEGTDNGPENWWRLNPKWKACGDGKLQSPIEIIDKSVVELPQLGELKLDHKPAPSILKNRGHDIMLQWNGDAGQLEINGTYYKLIQCHWHTPSEHKLNGIKFDLELHVVHQNSKGETAVIGIWYKIGGPDPFLSKLLDDIKSIGDKDVDLGVINPKDINFMSKKYYRYVGSLTTPPCTEGVIWTITKKVRTVSRMQLNILKGVVENGFEENARPTQELNGRRVSLYTPEENQKHT